MIERITILIVEDEHETLDSLNKYFKKRRETIYKPLLALSESQAVKILKTRDVDLVVLDLNLKDGSGFDIARFMKQDPRLVTVPIIISSGCVDNAAEKELKALGITEKDIFKKPHPFSSLVLGIDNHLIHDLLPSIRNL